MDSGEFVARGSFAFRKSSVHAIIHRFIDARARRARATVAGCQTRRHGLRLALAAPVRAAA
jgi:hypothetical protein